MDALDLDPRQIAGMDEPYRILADLRSNCPVSRSDTYGGFWNVFRYADVCDVAVKATTFSSRDPTIPSQNFPPAPPVMIDPPEHIDFRVPFLRQFSPQTIAVLEKDIRAKADELIDAFIERGTADLAEELFIPFPAYAALRILGLPDEDFPTFARWARLVFTIPDPDSPDANWALELVDYFAPIFAERTGATDDSIPSVARHLTINGRDIDPMEYIMLLTTFVTAGLDTTANAGSNMILLLDRRPDLRKRLIDEPAIIPSAVEEMLRYLSPLPILARTANSEAQIGSGDDVATMVEGEKVALHWLAANHDPAEFPDPEELIFERTPNRHVAFGRGPHRCIGMHLARLELRVLLEQLLTRLPDYTVDRDGVERIPGVTRQVGALPVTFPTGPRVG